MAEQTYDPVFGIEHDILKHAIPENARIFAQYLLDNIFGLDPRPVTRKDFTKGILVVADDAIKTAQKQGRNYVTYQDYAPLSNGMTVPEFVGLKDGNKRVGRYGQGPLSYLKLAVDSYDPTLAAATTFGAFRFNTNPDGSYTIVDKYDFGSIKPAPDTTDAYRDIRQFAGVNETKQKVIPVNVTFNPSNNYQ